MNCDGIRLLPRSSENRFPEPSFATSERNVWTRTVLQAPAPPPSASLPFTQLATRIQ
jgi:hypothetical protein